MLAGQALALNRDMPGIVSHSFPLPVVRTFPDESLREPRFARIPESLLDPVVGPLASL